MSIAAQKAEATIYPADETAIPCIIALAHAIWPVAYAGVLTPEQIDNMLASIYSPQNLRDEMGSGHRFFITYSGSMPIGYASAYKNEDIVWIKKIYVLPTEQGKGVGRALIMHAVDLFRPARAVRLLANPENKAAHAFYRRAGFSEAGEMPVRMGNFSFTDIIFEKTL